MLKFSILHRSFAYLPVVLIAQGYSTKSKEVIEFNRSLANRCNANLQK
jgi:hypothetical protein